MKKPSILFIENNDSFSWNVVDALPFNRDEIAIINGADTDTVNRQIEECRAVVLGPGPTDPYRSKITDYVRLSVELQKPLLGICLGFQAIGIVFGASLTKTMPIHGKRSGIIFSGSRLFKSITGSVEVMRYHSLALNDIKSPLRIIASTSDGIPMVIEHESLSIAGFQFHPDSYATQRGREMIDSFFKSVL